MKQKILIIEEDVDMRENSAELLELHHFSALTQKPLAFVCRAATALIKVKAENGHPPVKGKRDAGFSDTEEEAVELAKVVPFLLEDELKKLEAHYSKGADWGSNAEQDELLITC